MFLTIFLIFTLAFNIFAEERAEKIFTDWVSKFKTTQDEIITIDFKNFRKGKLKDEGKILLLRKSSEKSSSFLVFIEKAKKMEGVRILFDSEKLDSYSIYFPKSKKIKKIKGNDKEFSALSVGFEIFFSSKIPTLQNFQETEDLFIFESQGKRKAKTVYEFTKVDTSLNSILSFNKYGKEEGKFISQKMKYFNGIPRIISYKAENLLKKEVIESNVSNCIFLNLDESWFKDSFLGNENFVKEIKSKISP
ncbi:MAG: hypothetical protein DWQ06_06830 [Calditrichaeota bacterium]|nr:MAG: hypothetical protein DWQ06_06830 [Calditrichota bacterium]